MQDNKTAKKNTRTECKTYPCRNQARKNNVSVHVADTGMAVAQTTRARPSENNVSMSEHPHKSCRQVSSFTNKKETIIGPAERHALCSEHKIAWHPDYES